MQSASEQRLDVQAMTGNDAKSAVASELSAMFANSVLPWIRSFYLHQEKPLEQLCAEYCAMRGLPAHEWPSVHIPASFVIDNDPRHAAMRQYIALPRVNMVEKQQQWLGRCRDEQQAHDAMHGEPSQPVPQRPHVFAYQQQSEAYNLQHCDIALDRVTEASPAEFQRAKRRRDQQRSDQAVLNRFAAEHGGVDLYQVHVWVHARTDSRYLCVRPEQWAVHPANTPEMNSPAEHMVKTLKEYVHGQMTDAHCNLAVLKRGCEYQQWIQDAVQQRGNGDTGRWQIMRSVEKLSCIHRILSAPTDAEIEVQFIFNRWAPHEHPDQVAANPAQNCDHGRGGHPLFDARKKHAHRVKGTAGYFIQNSMFT